MNDAQFQALKQVFQLDDIKVLMKPFVERDEAEYHRVRDEMIDAKFDAAVEALSKGDMDKPVTKDSLKESIDEACGALMLMFLKDMIVSALTGAAMPGGGQGTVKVMYGVEGEDGEMQLIDPAAVVPGTATKQ